LAQRRQEVQIEKVVRKSCRQAAIPLSATQEDSAKTANESRTKNKFKKITFY